MLLALSVLVHFGLFAGAFGSFAYRTAQQFGMFELDMDESYTNHIKVASGSSAPLRYPSGFFAVKDAPTRIAERKEPEREAPRSEKPEKAPPAKTENGSGGETAAEPADNRAPGATGTPKFGTIKGNAFRPHLKMVYAAYERGELPDGPFRVTVTCSVQPDGTLTDIRIVKSSGNDLIDKTAVNIFGELSAMRALQPLSSLSSLSLTLDRGATSTSLSAVGFAKDYAFAETLATQLGSLKLGAQFLAKNPDEAALIRATSIVQTGNRLSVSCSLPNSRAGEMMRKSFGSSGPAVAVSAPPSA